MYADQRLLGNGRQDWTIFVRDVFHWRLNSLVLLRATQDKNNLKKKEVKQKQIKLVRI